MKTVEFHHLFDAQKGDVTIPRPIKDYAGSYPSRVIICGPGADELAERFHQSMSGFDHFPQMRSSTCCEITRTRDTSWTKAIPMLKTLAEQAGFEFREVVP